MEVPGTVVPVIETDNHAVVLDGRYGRQKIPRQALGRLNDDKVVHVGETWSHTATQTYRQR